MQWKIISFNVNGIRASAGRGLLDTLTALDADVYGLQETKATPEQVADALKPLTGYHVEANGAERKGYSGTAMVTRQVPLSVNKGIGVPEHDSEGRVLTVEYPLFYVVNVYVPNSGEALVRLEYRHQWDQAFLRYLKSLQAMKPVVLLGDLNVAHRPIDIKNDKANYNKTSGYTQVEIDGLDRLIDAGFIDTFRLLHPNEVKYSWWSFRANARANNIGWRIDYVLVSASLAPTVKEAFILNEVQGSDHCPVGVVLDV